MSLLVTSPYSGAGLAEVETIGEAGIDKALDTAYRLWRNRPNWIALHRRVQILERTAQILQERRDELALQATQEGGKPLMDSIVEATRAIDGVKLSVETIRSTAGALIPMAGTAAGAGRIAFTQKEPIGPVVAVSAFNHPLNLIVHQVAAAVAAGCPVIVKPAEDTPLSGRSFVEILHEAGLPPEWCQFVMPDDLRLAERMVTDSRVGFFTFIGSARVGWMLRSKLAPGTRCALEHGGVAPVFVADDADLDLALRAIAKGGFYHAGQVCVSVQRVFVARRIARVFAERLAGIADGLRIGDPALEETEVGPLIRPREVDRVAQWVEDALQSGAELLNGGRRLENNCYACTLLFNPPAGALVSTNEIFGPVICIYAYDDLDIAMARANALPYSFQAAIFTNDLDTALYAYRGIDAAAVMVNEHSAFRVDGMPFAGLRQSGLGTGGIPYTIDEMQIDKLLVMTPKPPAR